MDHLYIHWDSEVAIGAMLWSLRMTQQSDKKYVIHSLHYYIKGIIKGVTKGDTRNLN